MDPYTNASMTHNANTNAMLIMILNLYHVVQTMKKLLMITVFTVKSMKPFSEKYNDYRRCERVEREERKKIFFQFLAPQHQHLEPQRDQLLLFNLCQVPSKLCQGH